MPVYLKEHEVGSDASLVGFPTLGGCMGLVIQTSTKLYGFHNPPGNNFKSPKLAELYRGQPALCLYNCCRWSVRYPNALNGQNPFELWLAEIRELAGLIGYAGPVVGLNLSGVLTITDKAESAYCEYRRDGSGAVAVGYSLTSNTTPTVAVDMGTHVRRVNKDSSLATPYLNKVIVNMASTNMQSPATSGEGLGKGIFAFTL
jgi:hypothetical protein